MTGLEAGTAVDPDAAVAPLAVAHSAEPLAVAPSGIAAHPDGPEALGEPLGGQEAAVVGHKTEGRQRAGAGDVAGDGVDRLVLAAVAVGGAGVQQDPRRRDPLRPLGVDDGAPARLDDEVAGLGADLAGLDVAAALPPSAPAAVEDADVVVAGPAQEPPGAGGGDGAPVVVDDDGARRAHPGGPHGGLEDRGLGQRVASGDARDVRGGERVVEGHVGGPGHVPGEVLVAAVVGQPDAGVAHVQDDRPGGRGEGEESGELGRGDERRGARVAGAHAQPPLVDDVGGTTLPRSRPGAGSGLRRRRARRGPRPPDAARWTRPS